MLQLLLIAAVAAAAAAASQPGASQPGELIQLFGIGARVPSTRPLFVHCAIPGRGLPGEPPRDDFALEVSADGEPWFPISKELAMDAAVYPDAPLYNLFGTSFVPPGPHAFTARLAKWRGQPANHLSNTLVFTVYTPELRLDLHRGLVITDFTAPADGRICVAARCFDTRPAADAALAAAVAVGGRIRAFLTTHESSHPVLVEAELAAPPRQLHEAEFSVFSQNGEDGVLQALFALYPPVRREYVEFGVEDGSESNTRFLRERDGWHGLLLDGGHFNASINLQQEFIRADNIVGLFRKYGVSTDPDLLSVDIDRNDFWVLRAILEAGYRPRVVVTEVNGHFPPEAALVVPHEPDSMWDGTVFYGATPAAMRHLLAQFGYTMVYCESHGVNCFSVRDDVLGRSMLADFPIEAIHRPHRAFGHPFTVAQVDREGREWLEVY